MSQTSDAGIPACWDGILELEACQTATGAASFKIKGRAQIWQGFPPFETEEQQKMPFGHVFVAAHNGRFPKCTVRGAELAAPMFDITFAALGAAPARRAFFLY
ncbi:hypothetical protein [Xanthobacter sp. KR7-225]|uniref:hypothetical protein n=1 Tax=Xanthobacter sp. KR7-225 TaxID=3156613 RepID=UPI0032B612EC